MSGYTDLPGLTSRANSALGRIERIISDYSLPSYVRLARVAEIMAEEPILTDGSTAAHIARLKSQLAA